MEDPNSWRTPRWLWNWINSPIGGAFRVSADVCASKENGLHRNYVTKEENAMKLNWAHVASNMLTCCWLRKNSVDRGVQPDYVFLNPPFVESEGSPYNLTDWVIKCHNECKKNGIGVLLLLPAPNGELQRWSRFIFGYARHIYFIEGRMAFGHPTTGKKAKKAPFGCVLVVFDPRYMCEKGCRTLMQLDTKFETTVSTLYQGT
jgi:phage N-6-adenine-methyltransferase